MYIYRYNQCKTKYHMYPSINRLEYERECRKLTELQPLHYLKDIEKRGRDYHLDHIFPIDVGYEIGLPYYAVADMDNLQCITREKNFGKGNRVTEQSLRVLKLLTKKYDLHYKFREEALKYSFKGGTRDLMKSVATIRKKKGIKPSIISESLGFERNDYSSIENGYFECSLSTFLAILNNLNLEIKLQEKG